MNILSLIPITGQDFRWSGTYEVTGTAYVQGKLWAGFRTYGQRYPAALWEPFRFNTENREFVGSC
jgi:hypothetical protein